MKKKATLVILVKNETEGITALIDKIPCAEIDDVFVVDGQSKDGSREFFEKKKFKVYVQEKSGRAEAFRLAVGKAKHEHIIFFSPDGNEDPEDILALLEFLEQGYDMAIGSRFMKGGRSDDDDVPLPIRGFGNKGFTMIANLLWHGNLTDSINGFRAIKKSLFEELRPDCEEFAVEYQLSIRSLKRKKRVIEIPTYEGDRIGGQSTARTLPTGLHFVKLLCKEILRGNKF